MISDHAWLAGAVSGAISAATLNVERNAEKLLGMAEYHGVVGLVDWRIKEAQLERGGRCGILPESTVGVSDIVAALLAHCSE